MWMRLWVGQGIRPICCQNWARRATLYCFDQDQKAIDNAQIRLKDYIDKGMVTFIKDNFRHLKANLAQHGVEKIDGILYDLGVSSPQLERERGFQAGCCSGHADEPWPSPISLPSGQWLWLPRFGADFFQVWGRQVFQADCKKITSLVKSSYWNNNRAGGDYQVWSAARKRAQEKGHPAMIFQAIRIEVNDELGAADESIQQAIDLLSLDGRISVITFHSLEDRLTKNFF